MKASLSFCFILSALPGIVPGGAFFMTKEWQMPALNLCSRHPAPIKAAEQSGTCPFSEPIFALPLAHNADRIMPLILLPDLYHLQISVLVSWQHTLHSPHPFDLTRYSHSSVRYDVCSHSSMPLRSCIPPRFISCPILHAVRQMSI